MNIIMQFLYFFIIFCIFFSCKNEELKVVTVEQFSSFVEATTYVTDAEKYGWSIVQKDVSNFVIDSSAYWKMPDGINPCRNGYQVTQVSFNDAMAYCKWANLRLPNYDEYWELCQNDKRSINQDAPDALRANDVNTIGNVWELTTTEAANGDIRLAGGSYLCNENSCNGTSYERSLYVDKTTGNVHIGFAVVQKAR